MDIDEFRKIYMQAEGVGNTPVNTLRRAARFGKSISQLPSAIRQDGREMRKNMENLIDKTSDAIEKKEKGAVKEAGKAILKARPKVSTHTSEQLGNVGQSASSLGQSINELGSTAKEIAAGTRSASYDGQDLEHGIRFALKGYNMASHVMHIPGKKLEAAKNIMRFGQLGKESIMTKRERPQKAQEKNLERGDMDLGER